MTRGQLRKALINETVTDNREALRRLAIMSHVNKACGRNDEALRKLSKE